MGCQITKKLVTRTEFKAQWGCFVQSGDDQKSIQIRGPVIPAQVLNDNRHCLPRQFEADMQQLRIHLRLQSLCLSHSSEVVSVTKGVHYCVTNMPGAGARTSTFALSNVTTSFILALADKGWRRALNDDPHLRNGLNATTAVLPIAPAHDQKDVNFCSVGL
jgi:hypothetical protein